MSHALITLADTAQHGVPAQFMLAVTDTTGSAVTIQTVEVNATDARGAPTTAATLVPPAFPPGRTTQVTGSGTLYVPFQGQFFGHAVQGVPAASTNNFLVNATVRFTDGTSVAAPAFVVRLMAPIFGLNPGAPPNPSVTTPGALQFINSANSGLHLLGWV